MSENPVSLIKKSILVVDDDPTILSMLGLALGRVGYEVARAADAFEANGLLRSRRWDAVITDRMMPQLNGEDLAARIRATQSNVPVILLTGTPKAVQRPELFCTILTKPILVTELLREVGRALGAVEESHAEASAPIGIARCYWVEAPTA